MVDNFNLIDPLFYFNEANKMFFHCQIMVRNKDHQDDGEKQRLIRSYFIQSREHLWSLKREIVLLCEEFGARAYINVCGKDFSEMNNYMLMELAKNNFQNNTVHPLGLLNSAADTIKSRAIRWILDIDDISLKEPVMEWLDNYFNVTNKSGTVDNLDRLCSYLVAQIPTKNGVHLITSSKFDTRKFNSIFPDVEIKKNWMTVLYIPESIGNNGGSI